MTSKLSRDRLQEIAEDGFLKHGESKELARIALAAMDSEPVFTLEVSQADYKGQKLGNHFWFITLDAARKLKEGNYQLYRHAQQPVVDADDNFYSWFGREWQENYQHNQYTTAAKQMLGVMAESAWKAGRRAAMLQELQKSAGYAGDVQISRGCRSNENMRDMQAGNSPVIPDGSAVAALTGIPMIPDGYVMVPKEATKEILDEFDSIIDYGAEDSVDAWHRLLAAAPQPQNAPQNIPEIIPDCWCRTCRPVVLNDMRFVVCPDCGNKRCPRANDHRNACTGSNEPGQEGSAYPAAPQSPGSEPSTVPGKWIPVSEQMPPSRHEVLVGRWWGEKPRWCCKWATYIPGHPDAQSSGWLIPGGSWTPTHWMELPAAPQEVK